MSEAPKKIILDNNLVCEVLQNNPPANRATLSNALLWGQRYHLQLVCGGGLKREYLLHLSLIKIFANLSRAGRLRYYPDNDIDNDADCLTKSGILKSDDPHILALARISSARIACTLDKELHADFTNKAIIDNPRGKIWQNGDHDTLLK